MVYRLFVFILSLAAFQTARSQMAKDPEILSSGTMQEKMWHIDSLIHLTPQEARYFWPLYHQYMWKWERLMDDRIDLIQHNIEVEAPSKMPGKKEFIRRLYRNDLAFTKLQKKYYTRFRKVVSPAKVNQFMQIEYETQSRIRVIEQSIYFL